MIRTFGLQTLSGSAQPWFGDVTTAAFVVPAAGQLATVKVANSALYQQGDRIILGAGSAGANVLKVSQIPSGGVTLLCQSESNAPLSAWVTDTIIALAINCWRIDFQNVGSDAVYLGADNTVTNTGGGSAFFELINTLTDIANVWSYAKATGQDPINTAEGWMAGTSGQKVAVAAFVN